MPKKKTEPASSEQPNQIVEGAERLAELEMLPPKKLLKEADNWHRLAKKVLNYRRDVMTADKVADLEKHVAGLKAAYKALGEADKNARDAPAANLRQVICDAEAFLRDYGATFYPKPGRYENVEMFLVAAILAIGVRTFFVQPFKIPTNSMYPTYYGMVSEFYADDEAIPGWGARAFRFLTAGAKTYVIEAPADGQLVIPVRDDFRGQPNIAAEVTRVPHLNPALINFTVLPARQLKHAVYVGGEQVTFVLPAEINSLKEFLDELDKRYSRTFRRDLPGYGDAVVYDHAFKKGDPIVRFDLLTGDALFVDRMSYHFVEPQVGDPIVFRTGNIPEAGDDTYYIKRLVGKERDRLFIREPVLYRNGEPISGAEAFELNANREEPYEGYVATAKLAEGRAYVLPPDSYFAMGDNSDQSKDSRMWGYVPESEMVGRALFIYHPFTKRWGLAK